VAVLISGGAPAGPYLAWATYRLSANQDKSRNDQLAATADELASMIRIQWAGEAAMRRLNDPYPLPVRWISAVSSLVDSWDLITKLATNGAGWPPPSESWGAGSDELAGTENQLAETLARVPTGRLVVLGEPGAGKTMLMVRLVLDLLAPGRRSPGTPVPMLLAAASWDPSRDDFRDWLIAKLAFYYPVLANRHGSRSAEATLAAALLDHGYILPILDGLDEIPDQARIFAIGKLNDALRPGEGIVVTCRTMDFRKAISPTSPGPKVTLRGAAGVELQALTPTDIADYLCADEEGPASRERWQPVISQLGTSSPVAEVLSRPLMASLARAIYDPRPPEYVGKPPDPAELCALPNRKAIEQHLFDAYILTAYRDFPRSASSHQRWPARRAVRSLTFLAQHLQADLTLDLAWWALISSVPPVAVAVVGLFIGLIGGTAIFFASIRITVTLNSVWPAVVGLNYAVIFFVTFLGSFRAWPAPVGSGAATSPSELLTIERRKALLNRIFVPAAAGVIAWVVSGLVYGPSSGVWFGVAAVVVTIDFWQFPKAWPNFLVARCWFWVRGYLPWRLMAFLGDAHERGVLRQTGAVYQFRHVELQRRLASRSLLPGQRDSVSPARLSEQGIVPGRRSLSSPDLPLDNIRLGETASEAMLLAAAEKGIDAALDTKDIFAAIARRAIYIDWYRVESLARDPKTLMRAVAADPAGGEGQRWNGIPVSINSAMAMRLAWQIVQDPSYRGGLEDVPPGILAVALILSPDNGASRALTEGFGISHAELIPIIEEAVGEPGLAAHMRTLPSAMTELAVGKSTDQVTAGEKKPSFVITIAYDRDVAVDSSKDFRSAQSVLWQVRLYLASLMRDPVGGVIELCKKIGVLAYWIEDPGSSSEDKTFHFFKQLVRRRYGKACRDVNLLVRLTFDARDEFDRYVVERLLSELDSSQVAQFKILAASGATKGDLKGFLMRAVPDSAEIVGFSLRQFVKEYIGKGSEI
jgi:hypothetical protein